MTINFRVVIHNPLPGSLIQVKNQGLVSGSESPTIPTNDSTAPEVGDPTITSVRALPPLAASNQVHLLLDANHDGICKLLRNFPGNFAVGGEPAPLIPKLISYIYHTISIHFTYDTGNYVFYTGNFAQKIIKII